MSKDKKVVQLRQDQALNSSLPPLLTDLHERGWGILSDCLQNLLDSADDALFELADRALNASEQNLYFEAMREIRVHRRRVEEDFCSHLLDPFYALTGDAGALLGKTLALLDYDDTEEQVAVESMANKAAKRFAQPLASLCHSLENWSQSQGEEISLTEKQLPLGPLAVCDAFAQATSGLEINIKPKLVLLKLFDRHVVSEFGLLYRELSQSLTTAGFYVEDEPNPKNPSLYGLQSTAAGSVVEDRTLAPESAGRPAPVDVDDLAQRLGGTVFDVLKGLLSVPPEKVEEKSSVAEGGKIQLSRTSLLGLLQDLQGLQLERLATLAPQNVAAEELTQLPEDLADRLRGVSREMLSESDETLAQRDFDVINLVSLLFQYVLEDENLAGPMRGLLAHLQIPVLKAAMVDKRFFSKEGHPARLLLNTIADACIGWEWQGDVEDEPLYVEVESVVKDVLSRSDGSAVVFQEALDEFKLYLEQEQRRAELITQRALNAQDSKQIADTARGVVDRVLASKLADGNVPAVLETLLTEGWSKVLFLQYVQQGDGSDAWKSAVGVVDSLVWSVQPVSGSAHRAKLLAELPGLLDSLRNGLSQIGYNPYDLNEQLQGLEAVHLERLKAVVGVSEGDDSPSVEELAAEIPVVDEKIAPAQIAEEAQVEEAQVEEAQVEEAIDTAVNLDELDASLAASLGEVTHSPSERELEEADRRLARLQMGNWVEFVQSGGSTLRCRLAAVIASTGRHIFVNRSGMKVAEYEKADLLQKLVTNQMTLLDDGMLFDRALESVITNLRDMKDKPV